MSLLIRNAKIATMDSENPRAAAAVVTGKYFAFVGSEEEATGYAKAHNDGCVEEVDCDGQLLLPGFNDSHMHFLHYVKTRIHVDLVGCTSLKEVSLPESLTKIERNVFEVCEKLESIVLPPHITDIPMGLFFSCTALKSVTIPAELNTIGYLAFTQCTSLTEITCLATTPPTANPTAFLALLTNQINLYVPDESVDLYKAAPVWKNFNVKGISEK